MDVYLIVLAGQGDIYAKIVDKETFDWINSGIKKEENKKGYWTDFSCPLSVRERKYKLYYEYIKEEYDSFDKLYPCITIGSYENDRAIWVNGLIFNDEEAVFYSQSEAIEFIKSNNLNLVDIYNGGLY